MGDKNNIYWDNDRIMKLVIGIALSAGIIWLIYYLRNALLPFFVACAIAYMLEPLEELNRRILHMKSRGLASVITVIDVTAIIGLLTWITLPSIINELEELGKIINDVSIGKIKLPHEYAAIVSFVDKYLDPTYVSRLLSKMRFEDLISQGGSLLEQSAEVLENALSWLLTIIYILFILIDYPQISRGFKMILPLKYRPSAMNVINDVKYNMNHYFRGQGIVALFAMVFYCIGFLIVGLPLAVPLGLLVGILYMIPYFQYITVIPVAIICFIYSLGGHVEFFPELGKCALVYVFSQCVCDYVITPRVMGKELGLNPAIILLSLSVWGSLLGIIGMIIALPVTALIMAYYEKYISNKT